MNIVMIMSGGVGQRFGSIIPKQYNLINGQPVIDYVIDAVLESKNTDKVVVVIGEQWIGYSEKLKKYDFGFAPNGRTRLESVQNGLRFIHDNYECDKLVIVDAVAPFLYSDLIDDYFDKLDEYDAVITAQRITGGFTDVNNTPLDREKYIITQSPEAFRFDIFWQNFDVNYPYQEMACMLPAECKRYYNYEFKNNLKLTYDFELKYADFMLSALGKCNKNSNVAFFDKSILLTKGLKAFLLRTNKKELDSWIDSVYHALPELIKKWEIISFLPNQISRYGLVLYAKSGRYGDVIIKFIPEFVGRFERELEAMQILSDKFMCPLFDYDKTYRVMLLKNIIPSYYASFEENEKLTVFFKNVIGNAVPYNSEVKLNYIPLYFEELKEKLENKERMTYLKDEVAEELQYAVELYERKFVDAPLYIIHGDLHELNILNDTSRFWGIDPNGMLAPLEFECVRFIRNDVRNHPAFGYEQRFDVLVNSFQRFVDVGKLVNAFVIDMAFCTYNSVFENETPDETLLDLRLIQIAKNWLSEREK